MSAERVVVSGMALHTPLSNELMGNLAAVMAGRSAITPWRSVHTSRIYSKIGGDLGDVDLGPALAELSHRLPPGISARLQRLARRLPHMPTLGLLSVAQAALDAGLEEDEAAEAHVLVAGGNLSDRLTDEGFARFAATRGDIEASHELYSLDSTLAACVSELLGSRGPAYVINGACASGNLALLAGLRELRRHDAKRVIVLAPPTDMSPRGLHGFALLGALAIHNYQDEPNRASRPWDRDREGFVPAHGCGVIVLEPASLATARGARAWAELCGVGVTSDANHLTLPNEEGQARAITLALKRGGVAVEELDLVSAHATSTPAGDLVELAALRAALGPHAERVKINAPKSMLGHTMNASAIVEGVLAVLQMNADTVHGSLNIDNLDPAVDLDVCAKGPARLAVGALLNNAFGFGGHNTASVFRRIP
ncbi:beta-ketoacyl-[acyl-carrier-protein] synthase family protein [Myxococcota bacterium]|nr:beta-ketoacyl-[acyl-carrier-protein] synthase family protein [Myxococcota bacterium]